MLKKRYRRMKRMKRKSVVRRRRRRSGSPEVKYLTFIDASKILANSYQTPLNSTLKGNANFYQDIIGKIQKGTGDNQRIGDRIFVKFIKFHIWVQQCAPAANADTIVNTYQRILVSNANTDGDLAGFWRGTSQAACTHLAPDRRNYKIWKDIGFSMMQGSAFTAATKGAGIIKVIKFNIPINREVIFSTAANSVKNDEDIVSFQFVGYNMAGAADTFRQFACFDFFSRVYFTDA